MKNRDDDDLAPSLQWLEDGINNLISVVAAILRQLGKLVCATFRPPRDEEDA